MSKKFIFVSSPYSSEDENIKKDRFVKAAQTVIKFIERDIPVYVPIAMTGYLTDKQHITHEIWVKHTKAMIDQCGGFLVLALNNWKQSKGVTEELNYAYSKEIPIWIVTFEELDSFLDQNRQNLKELCNWS